MSDDPRPTASPEAPSEDVSPSEPENGPAQDEIPPEELARRVEALLFASPQPVSAASIARALNSSAAKVREAVETLRSFYEETGRAFQVEEIAGGFQLLTRPEFAGILSKTEDEKPQRLSPAALEVLSVIAYEQPVTRLEVESIRGVASGPVIRSLMEKGLVKVTGRSDQVGNPLLYGTTGRFLEVFGLASLRDLPDPEEVGS